jgi:hypothetical protein
VVCRFDGHVTGEAVAESADILFCCLGHRLIGTRPQKIQKLAEAVLINRDGLPSPGTFYFAASSEARTTSVRSAAAVSRESVTKRIHSSCWRIRSPLLEDK